MHRLYNVKLFCKMLIERDDRLDALVEVVEAVVLVG